MQVQLTTNVLSYKYNTLLTQGVGAVNRIVTTTKPVSGANNLVVGSSLNYLKFKIYSASQVTSGSPVNLYFYGWSFCPDLMAWVPQLLAQVSSYTNTSAISGGPLNGLYEFANFTVAPGDAKVFNGASTTGAAGFLMIDTLGCESIEFTSSATSGTGLTVLTAGV